MRESVIEGFRLSPQQRRLWALQRHVEGGPFCARCTLSVEGRLDEAALGAALTRLVARHQILRTTFRALPGMTLPLQVVEDAGAFAFTRHDLSALDAREQDAEIARLEAQLDGEPFDFERGPLTRALLVVLGPERHALILNLSALCTDGVGLLNLVRELGALYTSGEGGDEVEAAQYVEVSEWLNELLESEEAEGGREFWRRETPASPSASRLDFERRTDAEFSPRRLRVVLDAEASRAVEELCERRGVSEGAFALACWQLLLWRLGAGQEELVVGAACDGRSDEELAGVPGLFERYVPMRARIEGGTHFEEILKRAQESLRDAYALQECFSWDDGAGDAPFFPFCFGYAEQDSHAIEFAGLRVKLTRLGARTERFRLRLSVSSSDEGIAADIEYDPAAFEESAARRVAAYLSRLLRAAALDPRARAADFDLLGEEERRRLLFDANPPEGGHALSTRLCDLFLRQAELCPDRTALVCEGSQLSYGRLAASARALARRLRALGVGPEVVVPVFMERGAAQVEALLGVLLAGGAYMPLERNYPSQRLALMLEEAASPVVLTQAEMARELPSCGARVMLVREGGVLEDAHERNESKGVSEGARAVVVSGEACADTVAYVIYTSGSTGRPKGVVVPHAGVVGCVRAMQEIYGLGPADRFLYRTALSFDPSVWELFWTLGEGGCVVVASPSRHLDNGYVAALLRREQVTTAYFVPGALGSLVEECGAQLGRCAALRRVISGGEAMPPALMERFFDSCGAELHHSYGPTEVSIASTEWACVRGEAVHIGRPLGHTRAYVTRGWMSLAEQGVPGELLLSGPQVGRGYLRRAELTAERFAPDPFSTKPGARLYRTGDVVRYREDFGIEFHGRLDEQVKIRGQRVEPGEVESLLRAHESVREAAVTAPELEGGERRLVAYVSWREAAGGKVEGLRSYLRERLPEYMVPSAWVLVEALPRNASGKLDRRALPPPDWSRPDGQKSFAPPRTPVEERLASIWAGVLGVERVGVEDNFFDLGGHSLLATQVISRVSEAFEMEIPLHRLFESPTVAGLAESIETVWWAARAAGAGFGAEREEGLL